MTEESDLKIGSFYWVAPTVDPDADEEWERDDQPARFAGRGNDGKLLWHCLNLDGLSNWPMSWIGDEITK